ncbi:hypothetical protein [Leclercia sp.]|uniref:hypothetical protein n=1 Tax=Leclercia sp. TaxID=1898428 RepID=UPI002FDE8AB4
MNSTKKVEDSTFEAEFYRRVEDIKQRAKAAGTNITQLCRTAGVSRTTPERWEKRTPKSISIIDLMLAALVDVENQHEASQQALKDLPPRERERLKAQEEEKQREQERQRRERRNQSRRVSRQQMNDTSSDNED